MLTLVVSACNQPNYSPTNRIDPSMITGTPIKYATKEVNPDITTEPHIRF